MAGRWQASDFRPVVDLSFLGNRRFNIRATAEIRSDRKGRIQRQGKVTPP